ncbi:serine hydrolase [Ensifer sp. ENS02]|uniref:serine hydrolase domain-containing protein n=1 Tax=Ensifer sp. ENS02 TaxID=2769290 RepID=UPI0017865198|nr:serine hydrolase [Ensifer sp. ENS02]MBD9524719.1 serine hydrolase [Ensifer sp. ENS02]
MSEQIHKRPNAIGSLIIVGAMLALTRTVHVWQEGSILAWALLGLAAGCTAALLLGWTRLVKGSLRKNRVRIALLALVGAGALTLNGCESTWKVLAVPPHFVSHQLCSAVFVAGLEPVGYYREAIQPKFGAASNFIRYELDRQRREVRVSFMGVVKSRSIYEGPLGCRVTHAAEPVPERTAMVPSSVPATPVETIAPQSAALADALQHAFADPQTAPHRYTKAVVVVHRGRIIGERYASGVTSATPLQGWSMTKSVTNALLGILVRKGKLDMNAPAPIAEWSSLGDSRHRITSDQLLRMVSGIGCGDSLHTAGWHTLFDPDTQMEYDIPDQASFAAKAGLRAKPGDQWQYTNCNYVLLSRIIRDAIGGDPVRVRTFFENEIFKPLGIETATFEFDSAGTPLGTAQLWASARDWARFGLLYLRDGVTSSGQRLLPEGWVDYSAQLTAQSSDLGYGAGFWTQRGNSSGGRARIAAGMPADSFMAVGSQGQYTIVIPSEDLVIVRLGWSYTPDDDIIATERLTREVIAAVHTSKELQN